MRMWCVDPQLMCKNHLLGAHVETHMIVSSVNMGKTLTGFLEGKLIEVGSVIVEHDLIVQEMERRGFNHSSPLPPDEMINDTQLYYMLQHFGGTVDRVSNFYELGRRCDRCRVKYLDELQDSLSFVLAARAAL